MELKSWHLALMGFLSLCVLGALSLATGGEFEKLYYIFYGFLIFFVAPVIALNPDRTAKKLTAFRLWLAIAACSSFVFWDMPKVIFLYLLLMPVGVIVPVFAVWLVLSGRWIKAKGAAMSVLCGIILILLFCEATLAIETKGPAIAIILLLSASFYIAAGVDFFYEQKNARFPMTTITHN